MGLRIYDTKTRDKIDFAPLEPGKVRMYVCGITPYAASHVGHARSAVAFDVVYRWLMKKYVVTFVRNVTDVEDKLIRAANAEGTTTTAIAERFFRQYQEDMRELNCLDPNLEPSVTRHMDAIIDMVKRLEQRGVAYAIDGDVYFDVKKFPAYGWLSGRRLEDLEAGARVEVGEKKRNPGDFALWKAAKPGEPAWDSPWGKGRPGWHIECSAMAEQYLGKTFDIHGGGRDLIFPHHENEIAQSCAANDVPLYARIWMHNGFINLMPEACPACGKPIETEVERCPHCGHVFSDDELKMAKSKGNVFSVREVLSRHEGEALRLLFLNSHYRKDIAYSHSLLEDAEKRLDKNYETLAAIDEFTGAQTFVPGKSFAAMFGWDPRQRLEEAMDDDFNTSRALAETAEVFSKANELIHGQEKKPISPEDTSRLLYEIKEIVREAGDVLGLWQNDPKAYLGRRKMAKARSLLLTPAQIEALIDERNQARKRKDFKRADEIRNELKSKKIVLKDGKDGTTWSVDE
jgi:cysteinyl-tRNA synthetase